MGIKNKKYWYVWCMQGSYPTKQHETKESAFKEAERLLKTCGSGRTFVVLEAVAHFTGSISVHRTVLK